MMTINGNNNNQQNATSSIAQQQQHQYTFGQMKYSDEEQKVTANMLQRKLGSEYISKRSGPGGSSVSYLESNKAIELANKVFGFNGWSISIVHMTLDYLDQDAQNRFSVGLSCVARVTLKDGTFKEDVGYGYIDNCRHKGQALEKVKKEAATDAMKRCLRLFGNAMGNCMYDKSYLNDMQRNRLNNDDLMHLETTKESVQLSSSVIAVHQGKQPPQQQLANQTTTNNLPDNYLVSPHPSSLVPQPSPAAATTFPIQTQMPQQPEAVQALSRPQPASSMQQTHQQQQPPLIQNQAPSWQKQNQTNNSVANAYLRPNDQNPAASSNFSSAIHGAPSSYAPKISGDNGPLNPVNATFFNPNQNSGSSNSNHAATSASKPINQAPQFFKHSSGGNGQPHSGNLYANQQQHQLNNQRPPQPQFNNIAPNLQPQTNNNYQQQQPLPSNQYAGQERNDSNSKRPRP